MNKIIMAIIPRNQAEPVLRALVAAGYTATVSDSRGGVLRQAQRMLFIALKESDLAPVLALIRANCRACLEPTGPASQPSQPDPAMPAHPNGAAIFVWDLDRFEIY
jgi:uncharacterized protein YaaQ